MVGYAQFQSEVEVEDEAQREDGEEDEAGDEREREVMSKAESAIGNAGNNTIPRPF